MTEAAVDVEIGLLGPVQITAAGAPVPIGGRKPKVILALLAVEPGRVVSADRLADAAWGEAATDRSPTTLQVHVSGLRKALGPARSSLVAVTPGYRLAVDEVDVDSSHFEHAVRSARAHAAAGRTDEALAAFEDGLRRWRGPSMADLDDVVELEAARHRLDALRLAALRERNQLLLDLGRHDELVPDLQQLVDEHPFREDFLSHLMLALYRSGRQAEALRAYQEARERLEHELGLDPGPTVRKLEHSILSHSPSIELAPSEAGPTLRWIDGNGHARGFDLDPEAPPAVIGRGEGSSICLDHDPAVSRRHARLERRDGCWWVADAGWSTNGTFVNGARVVDQAVVADGDILRCGETALLVHLEPLAPERPKVAGEAETISIADA